MNGSNEPPGDEVAPAPDALAPSASVESPPLDDAPAAPPAKRGLDRSVLVRIALFAGVAIIFMLFRDRLTGNAGDLRVGDCFEIPAALEEVSEVQRRPCTEAHDAETMFVGDYADEKLYPSEAEWRSFVEARCVPAFESYVGRDYENDPDLDIGWFIPSRTSWDSGDREVSCWIFRVDEAKMSQSVKAGS